MAYAVVSQRQVPAVLQQAEWAADKSTKCGGSYTACAAELSTAQRHTLCGVWQYRQRDQHAYAQMLSNYLLRAIHINIKR
jgi:hypothetical protein